VLPRVITAVVSVGIVVGCAKVQPPQAPAPRAATPVDATFENTWNAVIDRFGDANIAIATMERASGFIATESGSVVPEEAVESGWANCGTVRDTSRRERTLGPGRAVWNVVVREAGEGASTVKATVAYSPYSPDVSPGCVSLGGWERMFEAAVKTAAEDSGQ
jgi:hypothetical protein